MYRPILHSRTGCITCKRRKKKCDERRPFCRSCERLKLECTFNTPPRVKITQSELDGMTFFTKVTIPMLEQSQPNIAWSSLGYGLQDHTFRTLAMSLTSRQRQQKDIHYQSALTQWRKRLHTSISNYELILACTLFMIATCLEQDPESCLPHLRFTLRLINHSIKQGNVNQISDFLSIIATFANWIYFLYLTQDRLHEVQDIYLEPCEGSDWFYRLNRLIMDRTRHGQSDSIRKQMSQLRADMDAVKQRDSYFYAVYGLVLTNDIMYNDLPIDDNLFEELIQRQEREHHESSAILSFSAGPAWLFTAASISLLTKSDTLRQRALALIDNGPEYVGFYRSQTVKQNCIERSGTAALLEEYAEQSRVGS